MMTKQRGQLIVFSGPSGVGKGTILSQYMANRENICYSVSATTRSPRPGEVDGQQYFFLTKEKFEEMIAAGQMLEYAQYSGNYYGTPKQFVEDKLAAGVDVVLEIEVQGAAKVRQACPEALFIFVLPPSFEVLRSRLTGRGTEDAATVQKRLDAAFGEMRQAGSYDYVIVNDDLDRAVEDLSAVVQAARCSVKFQKKLIEEVLEYA
ncbi:MAG: guanylate kinase [Oscillospiraceae bacterium]|nr:guanylate kinase [Oscillospiraceae bacterium]